jgi:TnpA family transposase
MQFSDLRTWEEVSVRDRGRIIRQEVIEITQFAVDTHGHTNFAMALAKLPRFDLCPHLKALKDRHLFAPRVGAGGIRLRHWWSTGSTDSERRKS